MHHIHFYPVLCPGEKYQPFGKKSTKEPKIFEFNQCKGEEQKKVFKVYKFQKSKWEQGIFCGRKQG